MSRQRYPTDLSDSQWEIIEPLIPPAKPGGRPRTLEMRQVVNAILYVVVGGIQWRMLPHEYPPWPSVYWCFRRFSRDGSWQRIHNCLRAQVRQRAGDDAHIDSDPHVDPQRNPNADMDSQHDPNCHANDDAHINTHLHTGCRGHTARF